MVHDDVPAAARIASSALPAPPWVPGVQRVGWLERRTAHMVATDPGGAWVAVDDGEPIGMALAIVRDGIWGLSLMAVTPERHARGTGTALLRAALTHAEAARGALILSSEDPRAMRMYARAGFDLRPSVSLSGMLDSAAIPAHLQARETGDLEAAGRLGRAVRGGAYDAADLELVLTRPGTQALMIEGRGFAIHAGGSPVVIAADTGGVAADLLWSCFAAAPRGGSVDVDFVTAGQDWAVRAGLEAGLAITPGGPVYTRGELGPLRAWIPSGALL
jgi:GNAT superfamily N-acetyltransferase